MTDSPDNLLQEGLPEHGRRCRVLVEVCPDMITVHDRGGTILFVSPASMQLLGYTPEEMVGQAPFDFLNPEDRREVQAAFSRILQKPKPYTVAYRIRKKNGVYVWFETEGAPILDAKGSVEEIVCISRDVTQRKNTEDALRARQKQFERLVNATPVLIWLSDHEGRHVFFNESWLKFTGCPLKEMLAEGWTSCVHERDVLRIRKYYRRSAHSLQPFSQEYRLRDANGVYHAILERAVPRFSDSATFEGYIGTCIDVSELKSAQETLKLNNRSLQQFKFAFDTTPDQMAISDREGTILYANEATERITGYSVQEVVGKKHGSHELWGGYMTQEYYQLMWDTIKKKKESFVGKIFNRTKSGEWYWAEIRIHPLLGPNGGVKYYVSTERVIPNHEGELFHVAHIHRERSSKDVYTHKLFDTPRKQILG